MKNKNQLLILNTQATPIKKSKAYLDISTATPIKIHRRYQLDVQSAALNINNILQFKLKQKYVSFMNCLNIRIFNQKHSFEILQCFFDLLIFKYKNKMAQSINSILLKLAKQKIAFKNNQQFKRTIFMKLIQQHINKQKLKCYKIFFKQIKKNKTSTLLNMVNITKGLVTNRLKSAFDSIKKRFEFQQGLNIFLDLSVGIVQRKNRFFLKSSFYSIKISQWIKHYYKQSNMPQYDIKKNLQFSPSIKQIYYPNQQNQLQPYSQQFIQYINIYNSPLKKYYITNNPVLTVNPYTRFISASQMYSPIIQKNMTNLQIKFHNQNLDTINFNNLFPMSYIKMVKPCKVDQQIESYQDLLNLQFKKSIVLCSHCGQQQKLQQNSTDKSLVCKYAQKELINGQNIVHMYDESKDKKSVMYSKQGKQFQQNKY